MEKNTRTNKECRQKRGTRIPKRNVPTALDANLEMFAKAVAEGASHVAAAVICGRKEGSASYLYRQPGVKERIAELQTIARIATEKAIAENAIRMRRAVDIDRNEIINRLAGIVRDVTLPAAIRVNALNILSKIFMLQAKNIQDVRNFHGWTTEELKEFASTGTVPERIRTLVGDSEAATFSPSSAQTEEED